MKHAIVVCLFLLATGLMGYSGWFLPVEVYSTEIPALPVHLSIGTDSLASNNYDHSVFDTTSGDTIVLDMGAPPPAPPPSRSAWWMLDDPSTPITWLISDIRSDTSDTIYWKLQYYTTYGIMDSFWLEWDTSLVPSGAIFEITSSIVDTYRVMDNTIDWSLAMDMRSESRSPTIPFYELGYIRFIRTTAIDEFSPSAKPAVFAISAYPNPFNSAVTITVGEGLRPSRVEIYDINGRIVAKIIPPSPPFTRGEEVDTPLSKGDLGGLVWQPGPSLGSGVYLVRASFGDESVSKRVVYLK